MRLFDWLFNHLRWILPVALVILVGWWQSAPAENQLLKQRVVAVLAPAEHLAVGDSLSVDLGRVAPFPWDTLYVFCGTTLIANIAQATGQSSPENENVHEDDNLLVFFCQGHLVGWVRFRGFNYQQEPHFVKFIGHFDTGELFTPATARFVAWRKSDSTRFIHLKPAGSTLPVYRPAYDRYLKRHQQAVRLGIPEWEVK